jgi:hypothetical protein
MPEPISPVFSGPGFSSAMVGGRSGQNVRQLDGEAQPSGSARPARHSPAVVNNGFYLSIKS